MKRARWSRAQVLDVDAEKERVSLGIKQLTGDPIEKAGPHQEGQRRHRHRYRSQ